MMPLGMVEIGESGVIGKITGQDEVRQHLAELGFVMGERVTVVSKMGDKSQWVDRLSLVLSLRDDDDPRVEKEVERIISEQKWKD